MDVNSGRVSFDNRVLTGCIGRHISGHLGIDTFAILRPTDYVEVVEQCHSLDTFLVVPLVHPEGSHLSMDFLLRGLLRFVWPMPREPYSRREPV